MSDNHTSVESISNFDPRLGLPMPLPLAVRPFVERIGARRSTLATSDSESESVVVYVTPECGMALLRGADLFCPGVVAVRNQIQNFGARAEVRVLPDEIHVTRGSTADRSWDDLFFSQRGVSNLIAEGVLKVKSRKELFNNDTKSGTLNTGTAVEIQKLFFQDHNCLHSVRPLPAAHGVLEGRVWHQHVPSTIGALALVMGEILSENSVNVLDMCAAPGGKTLALADFLRKFHMRKKARIVAVDRSFTKMRKLQRGCAEMGFDGGGECESRLLQIRLHQISM